MGQRKRIFFSLCLAALSAATCSPDIFAAPKNNDNIPASIERKVEQVSDELTKLGFEVTSGYFRLYTQDDCQYSFPVMGTCYANNPAAPYITFAVKPWAEEFIDPATVNAVGLIKEGYTGTFRFDPKEAILVFGRLPPPAAYFGLQTYLFTREGTFDTESATYQWIAKNLPTTVGTFFATVPKNADRLQLFASLSNSNNDVVVKRQSGSAFNQERFFIITPDRGMDDAVRSALDALSVDPSYVFTEQIPSTMTVGLDSHADDFLFLMRYAMPNDGGGPGSHSAKWQESLPLTVLRIRDTGNRSPLPYGAPVLEKRTGVDEKNLAADLKNLVAEVNRRWGQPCATDNCSDRAVSFLDLQGSPVDLVGPDCTKIGMNCIGDAQDTSYQMTPEFTLDSGSIYAVAGTLGTRTGNATYVGLSVNDSYLIKGVGNINSEQLRNTASAYTSVLGNPSEFYLYYVARDCSAISKQTNGNCISVTEDMVPVCSDPASPDCHHITLVQREYIKKGTERGPDSTLLLNPILIKLKSP